MPFREIDQDLTQILWDRDQNTLAPLLRISSHADASSEPRWLVFFDYLAVAFREGASAKPSSGWAQEALQALAEQLWGPGALTADELAQAWFALPGGDQGQQPRWLAGRETADRAIAIAELAGRRLGLKNENIDPDAWLSPLEQKTLQHFWANHYGPEASLRMPLLLVNESAAVGDKGRRAQLRLYTVKVAPALHGRLFRAPAATLLNLKDRNNATFEEGLEKVATLLKACLKPAELGDQGGVALLWSLHPEPMVLDRGADAALRNWGTDAITGASATAAFALGALWVLRKDLRLDLPGMALAQQQLRAIHPGHLAISAQLEGLAPPDLNSPLNWRLAPVSGLDDKLGTFVLDRKLQTDNQKAVALALVAKGQNYKGNEIEPEPAGTLADALEIAYRKLGAPLPEAGDALWRYLLEQAPEEVVGQINGMPQAQPATPIAPRELIDPLRAEFARASEQGPVWMDMATDRGKPNAISWYLLKSYARWAGGDHVLWGEPARLAQDFYPIELETAGHTSADASGKGSTDPQAAQKTLRARSLIELLDTGFLPKQPAVWVLSAAPAAGKTTMLAEFQMHHSFKALRQYAASGHFGVVPLWIAARNLVLKDPQTGQARTLDQALAAWFQSAWPGLGGWPQILSSPHARVQILLDGINELKCEPSQRAGLLGDWLDAHFGPAHNHRPPLLTVRSLELIRPQGAQVAELRPWDQGQRQAYVRQRLEDDAEQLAAMRASLEADEQAAGRDTHKMLYSSPGMLSLACTLMAKGLLPPDPQQRPMNRARLLATLIWSRLEAEDQSHNRSIPAHLLGEEERDRLSDLQNKLGDGDWLPPETPGPLMAALGEQARHMQFDQASAEIELLESQWWQTTGDVEQRSALTAAASHLGVVQRRRGEDALGRKRNWLGYRHQLLLEWFAAYGLTPDGPWPKGVAAPEMRPVEEDFEDWQRRKRQWDEAKVARMESGADADDEIEFDRFQLPEAAISVHEETLKLAAQLRGDVVAWTERLMKEGNTPRAARLALDNWAAFGEPAYPKTPLGPWLPERKLGVQAGTHPVLNRLREALNQRMYSPKVHLAQRIEAGDLLGEIGGSPLFRICGQALVLKDEHWASIGEPGQTIEFEMGDLLGKGSERTALGQLSKVQDLPAFCMAGVLVTHAQYLCFTHSPAHSDAAWWPGEAGSWWAGADKDTRLPDNLRVKNGNARGLRPMECNYWQAQAYGLWESAQRRAAGVLAPDRVVRPPSEAEWESGARWAAYGKDRLGQSGAGRWRFAHTKGQVQHVQGKAELNANGFPDVLPWDFNHYQIVGHRLTPVGVFLGSHAYVGTTALKDLAGNAQEWMASEFVGELGPWAARASLYSTLRSLRGGNFYVPGEYCRIGYRELQGLINVCSGGLRLVLGEAL